MQDPATHNTVTLKTEVLSVQGLGGPWDIKGVG